MIDDVLNNKNQINQQSYSGANSIFNSIKIKKEVFIKLYKNF